MSLFNHCLYWLVNDNRSASTRILLARTANETKMFVAASSITQMAIMMAISWCYHMLFPFIGYSVSKIVLLIIISDSKSEKSLSKKRFAFSPSSKWVALCSIPFVFSFNGFRWCVCVFFAVLFGCDYDDRTPLQSNVRFDICFALTANVQ